MRDPPVHGPQAQCDYATYKSAVEVKGNTLHYTRTYEIKDVYVPTLRLAEVKDFYQQVVMDERSSAVLRRVTPNAASPQQSRPR